MLEVAPFAAIRYSPAQFGGDLSDVVAPPYDVLDRAAKDKLLTRNPQNIVAVDLPHIPPKSRGPNHCYDESKRLLDAWLTDGVLVRERQPALYVYHQRFEHAGRGFTRRMFIVRVRLRPFEDGVILPHERTFGGPKEDRLALMEATRCNLSPVFALYADPADHVGAALASARSGPPDALATMDGVENELWVVTEPETIERVQSIMADNHLYIADGHHRYTTAMTYRERVASEQTDPLPSDHPANFTMMVLACMDDPGCLILPYHRAIAGVEFSELMSCWAEGTKPATDDDADLIVHDGRSGQATPLHYSVRHKLKELEPEQCDPWYDLDAAYLHRYLIDELLVAKGGMEPDIRYATSEANAIAIARDETGVGPGVALLTRATPMQHLRRVSEAGGLMPQKSTYFHPKLATGLTINPLA